MPDFWTRQIARADHLAEEASGSKELLAFYAQLLRAQQQIYEALRDRKDWLADGDLERDLPVVQSLARGLIATVAQHGPEVLSAEAQLILVAAPDVLSAELLDQWRNPSDAQFFAKAILQPYTYWLAETGTRPAGRELAGGERT